jgi:hypothetical protein
MPFKIHWYVPEQIIICRYWDNISEEDLHLSLDEMDQLVDQSPRDFIHAISDMREVTEHVNAGIVMKYMRDRGVHPRSGWAITVGNQNSLLRFMYNVIKNFTRLRLHGCTTMEEALAFLRERDDTIDWNAISTEIQT